MKGRKPFDLDAYIERIQNHPSFICEMVAGRLGGNHVIHQDDESIVFLNKYPVLYGYVLAAPVIHKEQVTGDFTVEEYLSLQRMIYRVAEAVRRTVETERVYILSLGSQQGNRHVHWHIASLPYGIPFNQQQLEALRVENEILDVPDHEMAVLAMRIRIAVKEVPRKIGFVLPSTRCSVQQPTHSARGHWRGTIRRTPRWHIRIMDHQAPGRDCDRAGPP